MSLDPVIPIRNCSGMRRIPFGAIRKELQELSKLKLAPLILAARGESDLPNAIELNVEFVEDRRGR